jgi:octaprenyl-diphosphate synthase
MRRLHLGQAMDIHWHRDFESLPGLEEYYTMCGLKTGCLARLAAVLGVLAALPGTGQAQEAAEKLGLAAEKLGVGFQILDDVKNLSAGLPGKKRGDDVVEGKKSLPVLLYLHGQGDDGRDARLRLVSRCFGKAREGGTSAPEVEELISALTAAGVLDKAQEQGHTLIREAVETFESPGITGLIDLIG